MSPSESTHTIPNAGHSIIVTLQVFSLEIGLACSIFIGLMYLASQLSRVHTFAEQKAVSVFLATVFSYVLLVQGFLKTPWLLEFPVWSFGFGYNYYFILTPFTSFLESLIGITGGFILYFSIHLIQRNQDQHLMEYPILFVLSIWFLQLLVLSNHLLITFIGLVGFSLNLYVMIMMFGPSTNLSGQPMLINPAARHESSIKYFYLSTFSSSLVLLSVALFYTLAQTGNFFELNQWISNTTHSTTAGFFSLAWVDLRNLALISLILGFAFKISAWPSHFWAPEVYQGSSNSVTAFIILPVKIAALGIFSTILLSVFGPLHFFWGPVLLGLSIGSMVVGALGALTEKKIKKFLAFSSINQVGFLLLGFSSTPSLEGIQSTIFFLIVYVLTNILFFYFFLQTEYKLDQKPLIFLTDINRLAENNYPIKFGWSIVFFSLAGLPPFAGFFSKFYVLLVAHHNGHYLAVFVGICTSLISAYYYLRVIKLLWFEEFVPDFSANTPVRLASRSDKPVAPGKFAFQGATPTAAYFVFTGIFCYLLGLFLTLSFIWNEKVLLYCYQVAHSCTFPLIG